MHRDRDDTAPSLLTGTTLERNRIVYHVSRELRRLHVTEDLWVRYPDDVDLGALPEEIRLLPAAYHFAPLAWAFDREFSLPVVDARAIESFDEIRAYLRSVYTGLAWSGWLGAAETRRPDARPASVFDAAALFTGGVDSTYTALKHDHERLLLVTIWTDRERAGQPTQDYLAWLARAAQTATALGHELVRIDTNAMRVIDRLRVADALRRREPIESWWVGVAFGMALTSLAAPLLFMRGIPVLYISSGWLGDRLFARGVAPGAALPAERTASTPYLDDRITLGPARVRHDGVRVTRQDKIDLIVGHPATAAGWTLRVCAKAQHETGGNCGRCEKCLRTQSSIVIAGGDPRRFGFPGYDAVVLATIRRRFESGKVLLPETRLANWTVKQARARERLAQAAGSAEGEYLRWLASFDFAAYHATTYGERPLGARLVRASGLAPLLLSLRRRMRFAAARRAARRRS